MPQNISCHRKSCKAHSVGVRCGTRAAVVFDNLTGTIYEKRNGARNRACDLKDEGTTRSGSYQGSIGSDSCKRVKTQVWKLTAGKSISVCSERKAGLRRDVVWSTSVCESNMDLHCCYLSQQVSSWKFGVRPATRAVPLHNLPC